MALLDDLRSLVDVPRSAWGAKPAKWLWSAWPAGGPTHLELHHSVTPASWALTHAMQAIQRQHQVNNGWGDFFYNVALHADGTTAEGSTWGRRSGSGLTGLTVVLLGNHEHDPVTDAQRRRLEEFYRLLPNGMTYHQERALQLSQKGTACCGRHAIDWVRLRRLEPPTWPSTPAPTPAPSPTPAPTSEEDDDMPFVLHDSSTNMHYLATPGLCTLRPLTVPLPYMSTLDGGENPFGYRKKSFPHALRSHSQGGWRVVEAA